uniref:Uncharacterized protein n=1 Tax=Arion vulgaris TaxID=1028688 RepID=A0A0B7ANM0_9EUPU
MRMNLNTAVARAYYLKMESSRGRGRPRQRWIDGVTGILGATIPQDIKRQSIIC